MFLIFRDFTETPPLKIELEPDEIRHIKARRLRPGESVKIGNGNGLRCEGKLDSTFHFILLNKDVEFEKSEIKRRILCTAIPSIKRWDWMMQKATELGVSTVIPVNFSRSVKRNISESRTKRIFREAGAQSGRFFLPDLNERVDLKNLKKVLSLGNDLIVFQYQCKTGLNQLSLPSLPEVILIGPEGGITPEEIEYCNTMNWKSAHLGPRILRIETAALTALAYLMIHS